MNIVLTYNPHYEYPPNDFGYKKILSTMGRTKFVDQGNYTGYFQCTKCDKSIIGDRRAVDMKSKLHMKIVHGIIETSGDVYKPGVLCTDMLCLDKSNMYQAIQKKQNTGTARVFFPPRVHRALSPPK